MCAGMAVHLTVGFDSKLSGGLKDNNKKSGSNA
jgi:hypothetical protein